MTNIRREEIFYPLCQEKESSGLPQRHQSIASLWIHLHCSYYDSQHESDNMTVLQEPNKEEREENWGPKLLAGNWWAMSVGCYESLPLAGINTPGQIFLSETCSQSSSTLPSQVCTFISINFLCFLASVLLLNSFSWEDKNLGTTVPGWVLSWTSSWASRQD